MKDGITVLVTTAYLDEAERCNRVGLMYNGRLIQCETPEAARHQIPEAMLSGGSARPAGRARSPAPIRRRAVRGAFRRHPAPVPQARAHLRRKPALQLERSGRGPAVFQRILPSLEDVFIALVRKAEQA